MSTSFAKSDAVKALEDRCFMNSRKQQVRVRCIGDTAFAEAPFGTGTSRAEGEDLREFGRRAIAAVVLDRACVSAIARAHEDAQISDWFAEQVVQVSAYVNTLRNRNNCDCQTGMEDVITAYLKTYVADDHTCAEDCAWVPGSTSHCKGHVIADCQKCARLYAGEWLAECCDQCGSVGDGHFVVAGLGDVNVVARLCRACGPASLSKSIAA